MSAPVVSVIVLNHNGRRWLGPCLDALGGQQGAPAFEIVVVDNASSDGSAEFVAGQYPAAVLVQTGTNAGFAEGNNAGARAARGQVLAFLNNDTIPSPEWLARLHDGLERHGPGALVTSCLVFMDAPQTIDSAGDGYLRAGGAFKHGHRERTADFAQSREVFGVCGAAFMLRRQVFEELGGFDPSFFIYYEDVDLSYRARLLGYRCWYVADAVVRHAGSATVGPMSARAVFLGQRNLEWTWVKNTPWRLMVRTAPIHLAYSIAGVCYYVTAGRGGAALRGKIAALAGLPRVLRARRDIQRRASGHTAINALLTRGWIALKRREKSARLDSSDHQHRHVL